MAKFGPAVYDESMESRKRKGCDLSCRGVPLPYLIRPRRETPVYDSFSLYNDYLECLSIKDGSDSESDDDDENSSMKAVETSSLEKGNCSGPQNESSENPFEIGHSLKDEKDEEYVFVNNVEALPNSRTERAGAIQMMELSKDASESDDEGSNSGDWVVL